MGEATQRIPNDDQGGNRPIGWHIMKLMKHWFEDEPFLGLMRVGGMEAASHTGYAEAFTCRKLSLLLG